MKKLAIISGALLLLSAPVAFAQHVIGPGMDLTWNNCVNEGGVTSKTLNCTTSNTSKLHGCFKVPITITGFIAVDCSLDLQQETPPGPLDPFWHYEGGGCNQSGLQVRHDISVSGGCDSENNPWGDFGANASSFITAYVPGFNAQPNRGRIFLSVARQASDPTQLDPIKNWYMYHLLVTTNNRNACPGCTDRVVIVWNSATLFNNEGRDPEVIVGPDKTANCAQLNQAQISTCAATPTRNSTWGQLKALYR